MTPSGARGHSEIADLLDDWLTRRQWDEYERYYRAADEEDGDAWW